MHRAQRYLLGSTTLLAALLLPALLTGCERSNAQSDSDASASSSASADAGSAESTPHPELAPYMGELQRFSQKLGYAIQGENQPLADFYMHEIDAVLTEIEEEVPVYDGVAIPQFLRAMMRPSVEPVEQAIDSGNWDQVQQRYETLISSCNACHNATNFGFIKITPASGEPPYNQEF